MAAESCTNQPHEELTLQIREFILNTFPQARSSDLGNTDSLLDSGIVDSMGVLEVVTFLESELGVQLSDEEMLADNFDSVSSIADFVSAKRCSPTAGQ